MSAMNSAHKKDSMSESKAPSSILDNPVYKKSPFYPFADEVRRKEVDKKKSQNLIGHFYNKVMNNVKDKLADQAIQDEKGVHEHLKSVFGEYFVKQMSTNTASGASAIDDDDYDDEIDNYISDDNGRPRVSELSKRSKLKSATSRSQTPSRSPDVKKTKIDKARRRHGLNDLAREALQNHMEFLHSRGDIDPVVLASMRSQISFGKKDRIVGDSQRSRPSDINEESEYILKDMTVREEFSDEDLFGEDNIDELIDKKNSFLRSGNMGGMADSFRSKVGKNGMRTNEDMIHLSRQQTPNGSLRGSVKYNEQNLTQRQASTQNLQQAISNSPSMNYLIAQCFNFDQIQNLKNHDGIKKKGPVMINQSKNAQVPGGNINAGFGTAISGYATDRRPIKMRDFGMLKGALSGGQMYNQHITSQNYY